MKKIASILALLVAIASCKPEIKPIGTAYKAGAGVPGTWVLNTAEVTDLTLPIPETKDISAFYTQNPERRLIITFNADSTYTVDQAGVGPKVFGSNGTWMFDTPDFPTALYMVTDIGDTVNTALLNMPRTTDNTFGFSFTRNRCDKDYVTYNYNFNRQ